MAEPCNARYVERVTVPVAVTVPASNFINVRTIDTAPLEETEPLSAFNIVLIGDALAVTVPATDLPAIRMSEPVGVIVPNTERPNCLRIAPPVATTPLNNLEVDFSIVAVGDTAPARDFHVLRIGTPPVIAVPATDFPAIRTAIPLLEIEPDNKRTKAFAAASAADDVTEPDS